MRGQSRQPFSRGYLPRLTPAEALQNGHRLAGTQAAPPCERLEILAVVPLGLGFVWSDHRPGERRAALDREAALAQSRQIIARPLVLGAEGGEGGTFAAKRLLHLRQPVDL